MERKKLSIVAPYFPPSSLPPAQRIRLMMPHLKDLGFDTTVYTVKHKHRDEEKDEWLLQACGNQFKLIELNAINIRLSRVFKIGDISLRFIPFLFLRIIWDSFKGKPDFILYPVPPWYILIMAPVIKFIIRSPFGIDYIDPWVKNKLTFKNKKERITQQIAVNLESKILKQAALFYSVSEEINKNILQRNKKLACLNMVVPYGVEINDYQSVKIKNSNNVLTLRYIGAVWPLAKPVLDELLRVFNQLRIEEHKFKVEFIGSSYIKIDQYNGVLKDLIMKHDLSNIISENPNRVKYNKSLELTNSADILFLFGDTGKEYAASKLMGLLASGKPFFAFLHIESYPYKLLKSISFPYLVSYDTDESESLLFNEKELFYMIHSVFTDYKNFEPFDFNRKELKEHTARGMTEKIITGINKVLSND